MSSNVEKKSLHIFMMVGHAGSGKSFFASRLAEKKGLVRLNGDSMRMALFGSVEEIRKQPVVVRREGIFQAVDYAAKQVLEAGHDVVYDSNNNRRDTREAKREMARQFNASVIAIWVKAGRDIAVKRVQNREEAIDQRVFDELSGSKVIDRHIANFDPFSSDEEVIEIDGTMPFDEQLQSFNIQLKAIND